MHYNQTAGWYSGASNANGFAAPAQNVGNPPGGGLDFFGALLAPPGAASTWLTIGWGCADLSTISTCAGPSGLPGILAPSPSDDYLNLSITRSALQVFGSFGTLDTVNWNPIRFFGNERAEVYIDNGIAGRMILQVFDENGNLVAQDNVPGPFFRCVWYPRWTGPFRIRLINNDTIAFTCGMATN